MNAAVTDCLNPVFVGGTGRSGSTITGRLLGQHPDLFLTNPEEIRFLANDHGMAEALAMRLGGWRQRLRAKREAELALKRCKTIQWHRNAKTGLHTSMTMEEMDALGAAYIASFNRHPVEATQEFVHGVMRKVAANRGARRWVDGTPANARITEMIEPIYPECQVIAVIRDGRDVAASFVEQKFGPNEIFQSLRQWETRTLRMHQAEQRCRPGRILTVDMLDLVEREREGTLKRIFDFLGLGIDEELKSWFDQNVSVEGAHVGRWREQFDADTTKRIDATYAQMIERLAAAGARIPISD